MLQEELYGRLLFLILVMNQHSNLIYAFLVINQIKFNRELHTLLENRQYILKQKMRDLRYVEKAIKNKVHRMIKTNQQNLFCIHFLKL
jgi:hypothetical protein